MLTLYEMVHRPEFLQRRESLAEGLFCPGERSQRLQEQSRKLSEELCWSRDANDVRWAAALVKCLVLCVSSQSGLLAIAERSTGTASCRIRFRFERTRRLSG
jgi:hypothetical protein